MRNAQLTQFKRELYYDDWTKNMYLQMVKDMLTRICELYNMFLHLRLLIWTQIMPTLGSEFGSRFVSLAKQV